MAASTSIALRLDRQRPLTAAALGSAVYIPQRAGAYRQQRAMPRQRPQAMPGRGAAAIRQANRQQQTAAAILLQHGTFGLKLVAATLAAATITMSASTSIGTRARTPVSPARGPAAATFT